MRCAVAGWPGRLEWDPGWGGEGEERGTERRLGELYHVLGEHRVGHHREDSRRRLLQHPRVLRLLEQRDADGRQTRAATHAERRQKWVADVVLRSTTVSTTTSQRSVTHDSLHCINILTYLLTYLLTYFVFAHLTQRKWRGVCDSQKASNAAILAKNLGALPVAQS